MMLKTWVQGLMITRFSLTDWEKKVTAASDVALLSSTRLSSYQFHNSKLKRGIPTGRVLRWQPPPIGWLKLNFDGAYHGDGGRAAIGFLVRDSNGTFIQVVGKPVAHVQSAEHVELLACKAAVAFVLENRLQPIIFEMDCLVLMQSLLQVINNSSLLGRIYDDLSEDLELIPCMRIMHVRWEANSPPFGSSCYCYWAGFLFFFCSLFYSKCNCC